MNTQPLKVVAAMVVMVVALAAVPLGVRSDEPQLLYLAPAPGDSGDLQTQSLPGEPLALLSLDQSEWVLVRAPAEVAQGLQDENSGISVVGDVQPGRGDLYLIEFYPWDAARMDLPDLDAYGTVIWQRGPYTLLQATARNAEKLSQMGVRLYPLEEPIHVMSRPIRFGPPPTAANPVIAEKVQALTAVDIEGWDRRLSGEVPIEIGGEQITLRSRFARSKNGRRAEQYVFEQLQSMGYKPAYFIYKTPYGRKWRDIVVDIPGREEPDKLVLLVGHLDSISHPIKKAPQIAPGADDNGTGSSSLLAIANLLKESSFKYTLRFVWFTGEEFGYWGSRPYLKKLAEENADVVAAINMDMIGYDGDQDNVVELHTGTRQENLLLGDHLIAANDLYDLGLVLEHKAKSAALFSDHRTFWEQGYASVFLIENFFKDSDEEDTHPRDRNPAYHSQSDQVNLVDFDYVANIARMAMAAAMNLAGPEAGGSAATPTATPTVVPTDTPEPPAATPSPGPIATPQPTATVPPGCKEVVLNGGFEGPDAWRGFHSTYTGTIAYDGERAARLGLLPPGLETDASADMDVRSRRRSRSRHTRHSSLYQTISLPGDAESITLTFRYWPGTEGARGDSQRVFLLKPGSYTRLKKLMMGLENDRQWKEASFDLTRYKGRKVVLYFSVYNNSTGVKGRTWMYLDDVSIQVCRPVASAEATPSH